MKFKITIVVEVPVDPRNLTEAYEANTIEEAAINQKRWIEEGLFDLTELIENSEDIDVTVEPIK